MKSVNYHMLGEIFDLLQGIELIDRVDFTIFDPEDPTDVATLCGRYLREYIMGVSEERRETLRRSIAYYTTFTPAPIQMMRDRCQDLALPTRSPGNFFSGGSAWRSSATIFMAGFDPLDMIEERDDLKRTTLF